MEMKRTIASMLILVATFLVLHTEATQSAADDDTTEKPASRKLRDFTPDDPTMTTYEHLYLEVTDPARTAVVEEVTAK